MAAEGLDRHAPSCAAKADAVIMIWLPGGVAQTDTWDPQELTHRSSRA